MIDQGLCSRMRRSSFLPGFDEYVKLTDLDLIPRGPGSKMMVLNVKIQSDSTFNVKPSTQTLDCDVAILDYTILSAMVHHTHIKTLLTIKVAFKWFKCCQIWMFLNLVLRTALGIDLFVFLKIHVVGHK
jgi:hypothetical protein